MGSDRFPFDIRYLFLIIVGTILPQANSPKAIADDQPVTVADEKLADLPEGLTSFGSAIANGKLYVYGGHMGAAHSYYTSGQNTKLYELDLSNPKKWQVAGTGLGLQGLAMVSHRGTLYRLGGFHAHNKKDQKQDLRSVADFAKFNFQTKTWQQLTPMPEPRSSFDAVVIGDKIYVVGGWAMQGDKKTEWSKSAYCFDLTQKDGKWKSIPTPPFQRRAVSVGFQGDHLVVVGGMQKKGGPTRKVALLNLKENRWQEGPELPGKNSMEGFGTSCFNVGGDLVASTYGGDVLKLNDDLSSWERINKLDEGRFFHRLLALNTAQFVLVGGANMDSGKFYELEVFATDPPQKNGK